MMIPCRTIAQILEDHLQKKILDLHRKNIHPKLVTLLLGSAPEQLSFVAIKERLAKKIGAEFELKHFPKIPSTANFKNEITKVTEDPDTTGMIIQQPLPAQFDLKELYDIIPYTKEIEGHKPDSSFHFPLSLAVLAGIKYIILKETNGNYEPGQESIVDFKKDKTLFLEFLQNKKVMVAGRGMTGGAPICKALREIGISPTQTHSQSIQPDEDYKQADIIITATGKKILYPNMVKQGVILLNVGLRKEEGKLKGDYDETEMQNIASYFTQTPGGLGPLDVLYLYKNLVDASLIN